MLASVVALAVALFWFLPRGEEGNQAPDSSGDPPTGAGGAGLSWTQRLTDLRDFPKPDDVSEEDWKTFLRNRAIAEASNQRVLFYGKVIDQNGNPVVGAELRATAVSRTGVGAALVTGEDQSKKELDAVTDESGRFTLEGGTGFGLLIDKIEKSGYVLKPYTKSQFMYGQLLRDPSSSRFHHPDPSKPVIFRMWKLGKLESIKSYYGSALRVEVDPNLEILNHPYVDFLEGKIHNDAEADWDLRLEKLHYSGGDWKIRLTIQQGGFVEAMDDPFLFEAPLDGYSEILDISSEDEKHWPSDEWSGYVKLRGGSAYGAIRFSVIAHPSGTCRVAFRDARINPYGSRNLQFDGSNRVKPILR